jgi:phenylacetate-CoA ligase
MGNYHEDFEFGHIECIDPEPLGDGRIKGRLIGTSFNNDAMPLIRYDTGDIAIWKPKDYQCPCGRKSRVIESIEGRIDDFIQLPDGQKIMRFDYLFKDTKTIKEAQVCQKKIGEVIIKLVTDKMHTKQVDEKIIYDFSLWICPKTIVIIEHVNDIKKSKTGKFKAVKSYL